MEKLNLQKIKVQSQLDTGGPRGTKQKTSISTYVWLFPCINHCGENPTYMKITIIFGFDQIYLGKTTGIHEWEYPHMSGQNQTIDQIIDELII